MAKDVIGHWVEKAKTAGSDVQQAGGGPFLEQGDAVGVGHPDVQQHEVGAAA